MGNVEVSTEVPPPSFFHMGNKGHVANGDVATKNIQTGTFEDGE